MFPSPDALALPDPGDRHGLSADSHAVALACAVLWTFANTPLVHRLLTTNGLKTVAGKAFTAADVKGAVQDLRQQGMLEDDSSRNQGAFKLVDALRVPLYRQLLQANPGDTLAHLIATLHHFNPGRSDYYWSLGGMAATIGYVRAKFLSGAPADELHQLRNSVGRSMDWNTVVIEGLLKGFDGQSFEHIEPTTRWQLAGRAVASTCLYWSSTFEPVVDWSIEQLARQPAQFPTELRHAIGDLAMQRGDTPLWKIALAGADNDGVGHALDAARRVMDAEWANGQAAFETALKQRRAAIGGNKHLLPPSVAWFYPLALLAQATPRHLELARKFCAGESGKRDPSPYSDWGRWVHAIDVRLGKTPLLREAFQPPVNLANTWPMDTFWTVLLAAWLGTEAIAGTHQKDFARKWQPAIADLRRRMEACRLHALPRMLDGAEAVLDGRDPPRGFFASGAREQWRDILAALRALGEERNDDGVADTTRIVWEIERDAHGRLLGIKPLEQKHGPRGWGRPRALSLGKIAHNPQLPAWDSKVARAIRAERGYSNRFRLDLAAAIVALVGHPFVVLAQAPEQLIDLSEATPEIELLRRGPHFVMRVEPPLRTGDEHERHTLGDADERREFEALRLITLVRDGPKRLRLVRFSPAQRQAALLVSAHLKVPVEASDAPAELEKTLRALSTHFQIHADAAQATRQIPGDSRLRAELSPVGEHLALRLVVAPLGGDGPRLPAAAGRVRLIAVLDGETVGTERDLASERRHLESVVDALPFLDDGNALGEWLVEDAEQALVMVETLPTLPAIAAVDWPKGQAVRVLTVDSRQLGVKVSRERDWFRLSGQISVDEGLVLQLETLLAAARDKSRFVPMGDGVYAALTRSLKQKLNDLAAVLESDRDGGNKAPAIATAWLDEVLDGTALEAGKEFRQAIDRLRDAQSVRPRLPGLLQASLRPYQEDGFQWAVRLATAGMGGCLADDMGLGKTLQALGVLLARAGGGGALVIAPTSVCGNWLLESKRFAPSLNARIYADATDDDREALVTGAGPQDVLIVSYTLLQLAQERFTGRVWHTVIADEAQAIKNAAAKRSQAVFELNADFRLALTGTPVENRLADLWSIMRFVNPGLLGSVGRFNERFAGPIERQRDREAQHVLKRLVGPFVLRRTKSEVLQELPPRTELVLSISPDAAEAAHYEALRRQAAEEIDATLDRAPPAQARFNILAQLTRLRRAACDPRLCTPELGIIGAKVQAFAELASELVANGHKALVFSQFVDFLQILREPLDAAGIRYQYLDGGTPATERTRRVASFQTGDGDLFLISLKAGGFGLNLTAADYVVIADPWWNPAAEDQAMGRAHRIGQIRPVTVYRLVTRGTVEERIVELHHEKRALAESILADGDASALPSTDDLLALIRGR
ncbi:MAG TPA: DEAD/DEAH box helicase [Accumulibacter sp.]|jgi:superfamily II DNA or RNA helicase|nr:DEAD/DEAH box helicase [Accumulibacter sp.]